MSTAHADPESTDPESTDPADADPTERSRWRPIHHLLAGIDEEIEVVYAESGVPDLKPSWVLEIIRLQARGPLTIAELAPSLGRTPSPLSQKGPAMPAPGWRNPTPAPRPPGHKHR